MPSTRTLSCLLGLWLIAAPALGAGKVRVLVQRSPLAGAQYHALDEVLGELRVGDALTLVREPGNRHDRHAVRVEWRGRLLGYVPRAENRAVAAAMDRGERLSARVSHLRDSPDPWRRLELEIHADL